jgi:hypothetical protein
MTISRRTFLIGTGGVLAGGLLAQRTAVWARRQPVIEWAGQFTGTPSAFDLGVEYLTRNPGEADRSALLTLLASAIPFSSLLHGPDGAHVGFHDQVRRDFIDGQTQRMGGWLLSRTELRLCALVAAEDSEATGRRGIFSPYTLADGAPLYWTAPDARFTIPGGWSALEFQVLSRAREDQQISVRIAGEVVGEVPVVGPEWQRVRFVLRPSSTPAIPVELTTTPEWKPANDFRTIGIGLDRI